MDHETVDASQWPTYQKFPAPIQPGQIRCGRMGESSRKAAGMKYIVITAKHHDGFAMYHSKASPFNIYDATPFKRDPLANLPPPARSKASSWGSIIHRRRTGTIRAARRRAAIGIRRRTGAWMITSTRSQFRR